MSTAGACARCLAYRFPGATRGAGAGGGVIKANCTDYPPRQHETPRPGAFSHSKLYFFAESQLTGLLAAQNRLNLNWLDFYERLLLKRASVAPGASWRF